MDEVQCTTYILHQPREPNGNGLERRSLVTIFFLPVRVRLVRRELRCFIGRVPCDPAAMMAPGTPRGRPAGIVPCRSPRAHLRSWKVVYQRMQATSGYFRLVVIDPCNTGVVRAL